jgi:two-component system phosphate regulon sensor histidine kinase PhoR
VSHRAAATRGELSLDVDLSAIRGVDVFVAAERTDVAVALDNLIDNAIAYTEEGGASIAVTASDTIVRVMVADTGTGIPAKDLPRIFERFYRVDRARSRESGGTGLGLALVRHVVERSGGTVIVASEEGVGTTFTMSLKRAR